LSNVTLSFVIIRYSGYKNEMIVIASKESFLERNLKEKNEDRYFHLGITMYSLCEFNKYIISYLRREKSKSL